MKPSILAVDAVLWAGWGAAAVSADLPTLWLTSVAAVAVTVARQDWANGVRPLMKIS